MDAAVTSGLFALGGVVVGAALDWARSSIAARRTAAGERDRLVTALDVACINLIAEARLWRALDRPMSKLVQLSYGLLGELPDLAPSASTTAVSGSLSDIAYGLVRWAGTATAKSLPHQAPVAQAQNLRATLLPLKSEITAMSVRLSMTGNEEIKTATIRIIDATGALLDHIIDPPAKYPQREEEVRAAIGQLRRARDAADTHLWRRRALRRKISPGAPAGIPDAG